MGIGQKAAGGAHRVTATGMALAAGLMGVAGPASAGSLSLSENWQAEYKLTLGYGLAMRMQDPHGALINGPVDPFQAGVLPNGDQVAGFTHSGLSTTINFDDGNRNFRKHDLIGNRVSAVYEVQVKTEGMGFVYSGSAFYDDVFFRTNANDSPDTINKTEGANDEFSEAAEYYKGQRSRTLEAYAYTNFDLSESVLVNLRFGKHLAAWGESLFFPGITTAQGPNDATKAFVPGAEIKEILLPVNQISLQSSLGYDATLLAYYQLDWKPTEVFPVGDFFSPADVVGPGAEFAYGSANPAYAESCPGLFAVPGTGVDLSFICQQDGLGGELINAPRFINVPRGPDIRPDKDGQWGVGLKYSLTPVTSIGAYYLRYHSHNPTVQLNLGFADVGYVPVLGTPVTTELFNQRVPVTYNIKYFDDIEMNAISWSSTLGVLNVAGEFIRRDGVDVSVQADISGVRSPVFARAETYQANASAIYAGNPDFLFFDEIAVVFEAAYLYVNDVTAPPQEQGVDYVGDGTELFYDEKAWAWQLLMLPKGRNVFPGWDIGTPITLASAQDGYASTAGTFGSLTGEGDRRASFSVTAQYLQNLEFSLGYNWFMGNPAALVKDSPIPANAYADRDYATFTIKYNL
ncbi:MAG TPA: DUF1302 family protein [Solimonas sp.]|nr:DUF1302 family protein [Solimonas sp.]